MRQAPTQKLRVFARIELIVVIVVVFVLLGMLVPSLNRVTARAPRIACINNLKQIAMAYRIWSNDHGDRFPASQSLAWGGWSDLLTKPNEGNLCWTNYAIMSNELGNSTKVLVCPSDERQPASAFGDFVTNTNLSYFLGVSSDDTQPQSLLASDRNLGDGMTPARDYGFSPENGQGNDVAIQTNSQTGPVCWSLKIHSPGNAGGAGNTMLGDGSVQQCSSGSFRTNWQSNFNPTTNWPSGHVPSSPSIRVLFP